MFIVQDKTRTYKKQIEDAEEIAALNLAKFRKAQQQLEEVGRTCVCVVCMRMYYVCTVCSCAYLCVYVCVYVHM